MRAGIGSPFLEQRVGKVLLFLIIALVIFVAIKAASRGRRRGAKGQGRKPAESMVACARCRVNLPRSEALEADGRFYCSEEHRRLGTG